MAAHRDIAGWCEQRSPRRFAPVAVLVWPRSVCLFPANRIKLARPLAQACLLANLADLERKSSPGGHPLRAVE